ncbi:MAG: redoxin family protein [Gemmataceae bacterium]|nr:redoxin family protein [Gemmataceae bacterium]
MAKARIGAGLVTGCLLLWASASASAAPTVAQMLSFRPKQEGIVCSNPTPQEQESCKVELVKGGRGSGWLLKDKNNNILRRYFDSNGDNKIDVWSYFLDGVEVYREVDSNFNEKADQFRWLHTAGSKYGIDVNEDGKIDTWKQISPEEVSQEVLQAVVKKDFARLQALMLTEADIKALELPAAEATRVRDIERKATARFQETVTKLGSLGDKIRWAHVQLAPPHCSPADVTGMKQDYIKYKEGSVTYINEATNKTEGLLIGELIQVGTAYRIIDAPVPGQAGVIDDEPKDGPKGTTVDKVLQPFMDELERLDKTAPKPDASAAELARYNLKRADILEKIVAQFDKPELKAQRDQRDQWLRQVADCLSAAVQNDPKDKAAHPRLIQLKDKVVKEVPPSGAVSHIVFCEMSAKYAIQLSDSKEISKAQDEWLEALAKFVTDYPKGEDTPDALMQLGMVSELTGKEDKAKKWYELLIKDFPEHQQTAKAKGAKSRLELDGKELTLAGPTITGTTFDVKSTKGKVVVVYYWASWNTQCIGDFAKFKDLIDKYGAKGVELVGVNLDSNVDEAKGFLAKNPAPGAHLCENGGMESSLGKGYGIMVLPTLFLVNKEGKVVSRTVQMSTLEDEIKKLIN